MDLSWLLLSCSMNSLFKLYSLFVIVPISLNAYLVHISVFKGIQYPLSNCCRILVWAMLSNYFYFQMREDRAKASSRGDSPWSIQDYPHACTSELHVPNCMKCNVYKFK